MNDTSMRTHLLAATGALALVFFATPLVSAQNRDPDTPPDPTKGIVYGTVVDAENGDPLPRANIGFQLIYGSEKRPAGGTITWDEGTFEYELEPGSYEVLVSYISYRPLRERIYVNAGGRLELEAKMVPEAIEGLAEDIVTEGIKVLDSEGAMLEEQREAPAVTDRVSSEQISKTTDSDVAEVLERVTGLSVVGGKYVFVRGLGERYSATILNGTTMGSPEPNKRTVPLDIFPSGLLDNVVVQKTYTPDMEGEFGGGSINVNTKDFVDLNAWTHKISFGYSENTLNDGHLTYTGGGFDFFGIDDGTRDLPAVVENSGRVDLTEFTRDELKELNREFENIWNPRRRGSRPNVGYSTEYSNEFEVFERNLGLVASGTFSNSTTSINRVENTYNGTTPLTLYQIEQSTISTTAGATGAATYWWTPENRFKVNALYTRSTDDKARIAEGPNFDFGTDLDRRLQLSYVERSLLSTSILGKHEGLAGGELDWQVSYSDATRNEPDRRVAAYELRRDEIALSRRLDPPLTRTFGESDERDRGAKLDWLLPLSAVYSNDGTFKVGMQYRERDRTSLYRRFGVKCNPPLSQCGDRTQDPEELLDEQSEGSENYFVDERTLANDSYDASQITRAAYGMFDVPITSKLRVLAGARYETSIQRVLSQSSFAVGDDGTNAILEDFNWLPGVNVTYAVSPKMNLRLSYSRTVNRPELRELSPFSMFNYESNYEESGNAELTLATLDSYDFRWEIFPDFREYAAISLFYKDLDDPIMKILRANTGGYALFPLNGDEGLLRGFEVELRTPVSNLLGYLARPFGEPDMPAFLDRMRVTTNFSRIFSEVTVNPPNSGPDTPAIVVPLTGQSDYAANVSVEYEQGDWQGSVLWKGFGDRFSLFGLGRQPDIYEFPQQSLDATTQWQATDLTKVKLSVENVLNDPIEYLQGDLVTQRWTTGRRFSVSLGYAP